MYGCASQCCLLLLLLLPTCMAASDEGACDAKAAGQLLSTMRSAREALEDMAVTLSVEADGVEDALAEIAWLHFERAQRRNGNGDGVGAAAASAAAADGGGGGASDNVGFLAAAVSEEEREAHEAAAVASGQCKSGRWGDRWRGGFLPGSVKWAPDPRKFLLVDCHMNQVSNRLRCYHNAVLVGGLLNWTLVVPYRRREIAQLYDPRLLFWLPPLWACYGRHAVLTTSQYRRVLAQQLQLQKGHNGEGEPPHVVVDLALCLFKDQCYFERGWGHPDLLPFSSDILYPRALPLRTLGFDPQRPVPLDELLFRVSRAGKGSRVVLLQDLQGLVVQPPARLPSGGEEAGQQRDSLLGIRGGEIPFVRAPGCPNTLLPQPHPEVFRAALGFVRSRLLWSGAAGGNAGAGGGGGWGWGRRSSRSGSVGESVGGQNDGFLGVHWRRGDLFATCDNELCRVPPARVAACVARTLDSTGLKRVFLASDATDAEVRELLQGLLQHFPDLQVERLGRHSYTSDSTGQPLRGKPQLRWLEALRDGSSRSRSPGDDNGGGGSSGGNDGEGEGSQTPGGLELEDTPLVRVMLDKAVCALADAFLGTGSSSFSTDIQRMRVGLRTATCHDGLLCEAEEEG